MTKTNTPLSLFDYTLDDTKRTLPAPQRGSNSSYLLVKRKNGTPLAQPFFLSPDVMDLNSGFFIIDMENTLPYWQKKEPQKPLQETLKSELKKNLGLDFLALLCPHPFPGLILLMALEENHTQGFYRFSSLFSQRILKNIRWDLWLKAAHKVYDYCETYQLLKQERKNWPRDCQRLKRWIENIQSTGPFELQDIDPSSMGRRFSPFARLLWSWTTPWMVQQTADKKNTDKESQGKKSYSKKTTEKKLTKKKQPEQKQNSQKYDTRRQEDFDFFQSNSGQADSLSGELSFDFLKNEKLLMGFPWHPLVIEEALFLKESLDYPVYQWSQIEPLLKRHLEKLSEHPKLSVTDRVTHIIWQIHLFDGQGLSEDVLWRTPYNLKEDRKEAFKMGLAQFQMAFQRIQEKLEQPEDNLEIFTLPPMIAWSLSVQGKITLTPENLAFSNWDHQKEADFFYQVAQLQNLISEPIEMFFSKEIGIPAYDFQRQAVGFQTLQPKSESSKNLQQEVLQSRSPIALKKTPPSRNETKNSERVHNAANHNKLGLNKPNHMGSHCTKLGHTHLPFYIYPHPRLIENNKLTQLYFIERTTSDWWCRQDIKDSFRDYYMAKKDNQWVWVFRDYQGRWFEHGLYS